MFISSGELPTRASIDAQVVERPKGLLFGIIRVLDDGQLLEDIILADHNRSTFKLSAVVWSVLSCGKGLKYLRKAKMEEAAGPMRAAWNRTLPAQTTVRSAII